MAKVFVVISGYNEPDGGDISVQCIGLYKTRADAEAAMSDAEAEAERENNASEEVFEINEMELLPDWLVQKTG